MKKILLLLLLLPLLFGCKQFDIHQNVVYLIGDSTMADKASEKRPETGWGERLSDYFNEGIKIENHAKNGRSSRSFIAEQRWASVKDKLKEGDIVMIQFGHNDTKKTGDRFSTPEAYGENLLRFIRETQSCKATPVLITPVVRRRFDEKGQFYDTHGAYPDIVRHLAQKYKVPLIDLHRRSEETLIAMGEEDSRSLFLWLQKGEHPNYPEGNEDDTHFSEKGATLMAGLVVKELRQSKSSLRKYLKTP